MGNYCAIVVFSKYNQIAHKHESEKLISNFFQLYCKSVKKNNETLVLNSNFLILISL